LSIITDAVYCHLLQVVRAGALAHRVFSPPGSVRCALRIAARRSLDLLPTRESLLKIQPILVLGLRPNTFRDLNLDLAAVGNVLSAAPRETWAGPIAYGAGR
jgi:hypothetical protein